MKTKKTDRENGPLIVRRAQKAEVKEVEKILYERHPQHSPARVGQDLRLVVEECGQLVAVCLFTSACQQKLGLRPLAKQAMETGVPVVMRILTQKEGDGEGCEKNTARRLVQSLPDAQGTMISGDALHTDKTMAHLAVDNGADYLLQVKGNQPTIKRRVTQRTAASPFLPTSMPRDTVAAAKCMGHCSRGLS